MKGWFSDLEILKIHQKVSNEQDSNTISDTPSINKQKQSNRNEPPSLEYRNATQRNNTEQTLTQEQKVNLENLKRIMNGEKITLPSGKNNEWRTVKTNKINRELLYISTNNITELNELIYAGAKLVSEKIGSPSKSTKKKIKTRMGNSTENTDKKNLRKQAKMIKQRKDAEKSKHKKK